MPKNVQPLPPGPAPTAPAASDAVDAALVAALLQDGRMPNNALAQRVGIAASTCLGRMRALRERGVVRGVHADVDLAKVGLGVQAMIAVRFSGHLRRDVDAFAAEVAELPGVLAVHNVSGSTDFLVHVAAASPEALRNLVLDNLTGRTGVVHAETSLIFQTVRGRRPLG